MEQMHDNQSLAEEAIQELSDAKRNHDLALVKKKKTYQDAVLNGKLWYTLALYEEVLKEGKTLLDVLRVALTDNRELKQNEQKLVESYNHFAVYVAITYNVLFSDSDEEQDLEAMFSELSDDQKALVVVVKTDLHKTNEESLAEHEEFEEDALASLAYNQIMHDDDIRDFSQFEHTLRTNLELEQDVFRAIHSFLLSEEKSDYDHLPLFRAIGYLFVEDEPISTDTQRVIQWIIGNPPKTTKLLDAQDPLFGYFFQIFADEWKWK